MNAVNVDLGAIGKSVKDIGGGITDFIANIQGKLSPEQAAEVTKLQMASDSAINAAQAAIDAAEAVSKSIYIAGWRPLIGWVCALAFALNFLISPIVQSILIGAGSAIKLPQLDMAALYSVMLPMLGLIGARTYEKAKGVDTKTI
jgi:hypothetical protein